MVDGGAQAWTGFTLRQILRYRLAPRAWKYGRAHLVTPVGLQDCPLALLTRDNVNSSNREHLLECEHGQEETQIRPKS